jgi:glutamine phosphoribosylpyrophosphate amidotransferase
MGVLTAPSPVKAKAPVAAIRPGQTRPEIIPNFSGHLCESDGDISLALEGNLSYRRALAFHNNIKDEGTDSQLASQSLARYTERFSSFPRAFHELLVHMKGEFSIMATFGDYIYASRDMRGRGPDLFIGQSSDGLQAISSDPAGLEDCGADEISLLQRHEMVQLGSTALRIIPWILPEQAR